MTMRTTLACFALLFGILAVAPESAHAARKKKARASETKQETAEPSATEAAPPPVAEPAPPPEPPPEPEPAPAAVEPEPEPAAAANVSAASAGGASGKKPKGQRGLLIELEPYWDDGTQFESYEVYGMERLEPEEREVGVSRPYTISVAVSFLAPVTRLIRLGGGFRYMSSYIHRTDVPEDYQVGELPPPRQDLGRMIELYGRAELLIPLVKPKPAKAFFEGLDLVPTLEVGFPMLFPGEDLQTRIDELQDENFNVSSAPRLGIMVGGDIAVRYSFAKWFAVRLGMGIRYERLYLYDATTEDDAVSTSKRMNIIRARMPVLGIEFGF